MRKILTASCCAAFLIAGVTLAAFAQGQNCTMGCKVVQAQTSIGSGIFAGIGGSWNRPYCGFFGGQPEAQIVRAANANPNLVAHQTTNKRFFVIFGQMCPQCQVTTSQAAIEGMVPPLPGLAAWLKGGYCAPSHST